MHFTSIALIPKPKISQENKTRDQYPLCKNPGQNTCKLNPTAYKKDYTS